MAWDDNLTGTALEIARTNASPLRVQAGPGTGKSYAMKRRVARRLADGEDPKRILAVTFTRTAAADLVGELASLGTPGCDQVVAGTLHGFCFRLLASQLVFQHTGRQPRPLITFTKSGVLRFEAAPMVADLHDKDFGGGRDRTKRIRAFEADWARLQADTLGWPSDPVDQRFHAQLIAWLKFHGAMLVGELVPVSGAYLRNNPGAPALSDYDHVIVDEYQDLNKAEQELIDLLALGASLTIVGDEDQSIYRFRHANPEGIVTFHQSHSGTHDETLDECRRCPLTVVKMADALIGRNHPGSAGPKLAAMVGQPAGSVHVVQWDTLDDEMDGVAGFVHHAVAEGTAPGDILILSPRKHMGYGVRDRLLDQKVPVHSFYAEKDLEVAEAQEAFALLALAAVPDDRIAYRFWLGFESQGWLPGQYARLRRQCEATGKAPRDMMDEVAAGTTSISGVQKLIARHRLLTSRLSALSGLTGDDLVEAVFPSTATWATGFREVWESRGKSDAEPPALLDLLRTHVSNPDVPDGDYVRIMSLHKSKGLTSKIVVVMGCSNGLVPFVDRDATPAEAAEIEKEQRRLFYVALTRVKATLVLSSPRRVNRSLAYKLGMQVVGSRSKMASCVASPFMNELGPSAPVATMGSVWMGNEFR